MPLIANSFQEIADRLGLTLDVKSGLVDVPHVHGTVDGQPVRCVWTDRGTRVEALLEPPLDLGLAVYAKNFTFSLGASDRVIVSDPGWDDEVDATADDPERAVHLLNPDVRGAALALNAENMSFDLTDEKVAVGALQFDVESSIRAVTQVSRLARLVQEARADVPPPPSIADHVGACVRFAERHGLATEPTPFRMAGDLRAARLSLGFRRVTRRVMALDLHVRSLAEPHGFGLHVRPETMLDRVRTFFGGEDLVTGDPAFDPAFLVRAAEQDRALGALDADVRALLLDLKKRFSLVELSDSALTVSGLTAKLPAADMEAVIEMACTVVERVERASAAVVRGPYR